jgi:hypothetical protein
MSGVLSGKSAGEIPLFQKFHSFVIVFSARSSEFWLVFSGGIQPYALKFRFPILWRRAYTVPLIINVSEILNFTRPALSYFPEIKSFEEMKYARAKNPKPAHLFYFVRVNTLWLYGIEVESALYYRNVIL